MVKKKSHGDVENSPKTVNTHLAYLSGCINGFRKNNQNKPTSLGNLDSNKYVMDVCEELVKNDRKTPYHQGVILSMHAPLAQERLKKLHGLN